MQVLTLIKTCSKIALIIYVFHEGFVLIQLSLKVGMLFSKSNSLDTHTEAVLVLIFYDVMFQLFRLFSQLITISNKLKKKSFLMLYQESLLKQT